MSKKRTSPVWTPSKEEMEGLVEKSNTIGEVLAFFGMQNKGCNYKTLRRRLDTDGIDFSKFKGNWGRGQLKPFIPLSEILQSNRPFGSSKLKKRLIKEGLLKDECVECGQLPIWNGKPLSLELDHKNGDSNDNRLENLQILCGHCHSQTSTFRGRKLRRFYNCPRCGRKRSKHSIHCNVCSRAFSKPDQRKVIWPTETELKKLVWEMPITKIAQTYGVSDVAVHKWIAKYHLEKPKRGHWLNKKELT